MKTRSIGPYSKPDRIAKLDGRTKISRIANAFRTGLIDSVGGRPDGIDLEIIENTTDLKVRCELMGARASEDDSMTEREGRQLLAWQNALTRNLRLLKRQAAKAKADRIPTIADIAARHANAAEAAPA
jgi:hypothetical protein